MKQKIAIFVEEEIIRLAKRRAAEERRAAYRLFCEQPMKIPLDELRHVLGDDIYESR